MSSSNVPNQSSTRRREFRPATPSSWFLALAQSVINIDLSLHNRVHIDERDLQLLTNLPAGMGTILTPNHADETDPTVCFDVSRRSKRRFILMGNREAFDEYFGLGGWALQHLGVFSVERGGRDVAAKRYATDVVRSGRDTLVIFPEGEIFYLNESVQPFHSGAIDIGIRAIIEERKTRPDWTAYIVPLAIKYRYLQAIDAALDKRVRKMEQRVSRDTTGMELKARLASLMAEAVSREEVAYNVKSKAEKFGRLSERVSNARHAILEQVQDKYFESYDDQARTIDRAFQLSAYVREKMAEGVVPDQPSNYKQDLKALKEVQHMVSWQPSYIDSDPSSDRLAEMVLKLERELYGIKRPKQLARRDVYLRIGTPVDLGAFVDEYAQDVHAVRHRVAEQLRTTIQGLIDEISIATAVQ